MQFLSRLLLDARVAMPLVRGVSVLLATCIVGGAVFAVFATAAGIIA